MIRITDKTLACLDRYEVCGEQLRSFAELLVDIGVETIEVSEKARFLLGDLPRGGNYVLSGSKAEITITDPSEVRAPAEFERHEALRVCGLDKVLLGNYLEVFKQLCKTLGHQIELCPTNDSFCATAIAAEWIHFGGQNVVTSFGGVGGYAATEELIVYLHAKNMQDGEQGFPELALMRSKFEALTGMPISRNKPVLGEGIFVVESGIHVDGIVKQPRCYEPFPPESVGLARAITLSKQSGMTSIRAKLEEQSLFVEQQYLFKLLAAVRERSIAVNGYVSDEEFACMATEIAAFA